jgi:hypothetical protein
MKEWKCRRDATSVGYAFISRLWKSEDSHGGSASRKSKNVPGGGIDGDQNSALVGAKFFQLVGEECIDTGTEVGGTRKVLYTWME